MITYEQRTVCPAYLVFHLVEAMTVPGLRSRARRFESCRGHKILTSASVR